MKRNVFGIVLPVVWIALGVIPFAIALGSPARADGLALGLSGQPNGALPRVSMIGIHATATALAAFVAWLMTRPGTRSRTVSATCGITAFVGSMFAAISVIVVLANLDAGSGRRRGADAARARRDHRGGQRGHLRRRVARDALARRPRRGRGGRAGDRRARARRARDVDRRRAQPRVLVEALALVAIAVIARMLAPGWTAGAGLVMAVTFGAFAEIHARVDERGLTIAFGPWRLPRMRWPLDKIRSVRAIDIEPMKNGGWGYRGSLALLGRAALIVRRGEGLELQLDGDRVLIVSVDDARTAAGLLNDLLARR